MGNAGWVIRDLIFYYNLIRATVHVLYAVRDALLKHMSVLTVFTGTVVSP